jgi:hypothetical protein
MTTALARLDLFMGRYICPTKGLEFDAEEVEGVLVDGTETVYRVIHPSGETVDVDLDMTSQVEKLTLTFDELDDRAKDKAREWCGGAEHVWEEARESMDAFLKFFDSDVDIRHNYYVTVTKTPSALDNAPWGYDQHEELSGPRLAKWIYNNYVLDAPKAFYKNGKKRYSNILREPRWLSGVSYDLTLMDTILQFVNTCGMNWQSATFEDLIKSSVEDLMKVAEEEVEYSYSDEAVRDACDANGWVFDTAGRLKS